MAEPEENVSETVPKPSVFSVLYDLITNAYGAFFFISSENVDVLDQICASAAKSRHDPPRAPVDPPPVTVIHPRRSGEECDHAGEAFKLAAHPSDIVVTLVLCGSTSRPPDSNLGSLIAVVFSTPLASIYEPEDKRENVTKSEKPFRVSSIMYPWCRKSDVVPFVATPLLP